MRRGLLFLLAVVSNACRLNPECFGSDECTSGQVCRAGSCVAATTTDAGAADAALDDARTPDAAGTDADAAAADAAGADAARADTAIDEAGCPAPTGEHGYPLEDEQAEFGDRLLFHFDEDLPTQQTARETSASGRAPARCNTANGTCPASTCGRYGRGAVFDGIDDQLRIPGVDYDFANDANYTIEAWVKLEGARTSTQCFFDYLTSAGDRTEMSLCVTPDGRLVQPSDPPNVSTAAIADSEWHHIGLIRYADAYTLEFYLDGVRVSETALAVRGGSVGGTIEIGGGADRGRFEGQLDELRLSRKPLFYDVDFSIHQRRSALVWSHGEDLWISTERGRDARLFIAGAYLPRFSSDGSQLAFLRCPSYATGPCDLSLARWDGTDERTVTSSVAPLQGSFSLDGSWFYYIRGSGCGTSELRRASTTGATDEQIYSGPEQLDAVEIGPRAEGFESLYIAQRGCPGQAEIRYMPEPSPSSGTMPIYNSSVAGARFSNLRALQCEGCPEDLIYLLEENGSSRFLRGHRAGFKPMPTLDNASSIEFGLRAYWYYVVADFNAGNPQNEALHVFDFAANALIPVTQPGTGPDRFPDFVVIRDP